MSISPISASPPAWPHTPYGRDPGYARSPADWLWSQVRAYDARSRGHDDDFYTLCSAAISDIWCLFHLSPEARSARQLIATTDHPDVAAIDLDAVAIPSEPRTSPLADMLDAEASYFLSLGSDLARLAAWSLLHRADEAERWGADTVAQYDRKAAGAGR